MVSSPIIQLSSSFQLGRILQELNFLSKCKQEKKHLRRNIDKVVIKGTWPETSLVHLVFPLLRNADFQVIIWMPFAKTVAFISWLVFLRRIRRVNSFCIWYLHSHASYLASALEYVCVGLLYQRFWWMLFEEWFLSWNNSGIKIHCKHLLRAAKSIYNNNNKAYCNLDSMCSCFHHLLFWPKSPVISLDK